MNLRHLMQATLTTRETKLLPEPAPLWFRFRGIRVGNDIKKSLATFFTPGDGISRPSGNSPHAQFLKKPDHNLNGNAICGKEIFPNSP